MPADLEWKDAAQYAQKINYGDEGEQPHEADELVMDLLEESLQDSTQATRAGRAKYASAQDLWDPETTEDIAEKIDAAALDEKDEVDQKIEDLGLMEFEDTFQAERLRNLKGEVVSRRVRNLATPRQVLINNFFNTTTARDGEGRVRTNRLVEFVEVVETFQEMTYYEIDPRSGDIPSVDIGFSTDSERINPRGSTYGAKVEYEDFMNRVLDEVPVSDILAMMTLGWSKSSAEARESDASQFLRRYLDPKPAFDNKGDKTASRYGQLSGRAIDGTPNGTFDIDQDLPRLMNFMQFELGMDMDNLILLLPRDAWNLMNFRKGYRRFIGRDGEPLRERPEYTEGGPEAALSQDGRYGIRGQDVGYDDPQAAANYLAQSREGKGSRAAAQMAPGPFPFLPSEVPNLMDEFRLPNSAMGDLKVVLSKHAQAKHRYYSEDSDLHEDDVTGNERPIKVTDMLFFDGNKPLNLIETIPPTSWTANDEVHRRSMVVMVEGYGMANTFRGQQAAVVRNAVLDDNYTHEIRRQAHREKITDLPLGEGGLQETQ